jgi:hypothetical protein
MKRGTVEFLVDDHVNEAGEVAGWLTVAHKTGKHKHYMPWQRATEPGSRHIVGVRCTRVTDNTWELDEENGVHWLERVVTVGNEPIKTEDLKPRPATADRSMADFDEYYDPEEVGEKHKKTEPVEPTSPEPLLEQISEKAPSKASK